MRPKGYAEFRRGWPIVLASMLGVACGLAPLPFYTIGVIAPHLAAEFYWGMGQIFFAVTITTLAVVVAGPAAGFIATRCGTRRTALWSLFLFSLAFMSLGLSNGSLPLFYVTWAVVAALGAGTLPITWTRGVNSWFDERKGLALGLTLMGSGLFGVFSKSLTTALIDAFGWRGAYVGLGLLPLVIALPVAWLFFRNTDGDPGSANGGLRGGPGERRKPLEGFTFGETMRSWRFWLMGAAFIPISFALGGPVPNLENLLKVHGFTKGDVLKLTPLIGLSALVGRLVGGWLIDRVWAPAVAMVILAAPAVSCWILAAGTLGFGQALFAIVLIGFALGVEYDVMAFFVARYFGMRAYTPVYALLYVFFALGAGFGPAVFGWGFDRTGSYATMLTICSVVLVAGATSLLALGRYRFAATSAAAARPATRPNVTAEQSPIAGR